jgi:hypothetical protein
MGLRCFLLGLWCAAAAAAHAAEQGNTVYDVTVSQRVAGKWKPTGEKTTYQTLADALRAVAKINADPNRMAKYEARKLRAAPAEPPSFVGTWIPQGEKRVGTATTGAPGVVREQLFIQPNGVVVHHDTYYGMVRCQAQINGASISLTHDKGWGGRDARWTFTGKLEGDKIVGAYRYVDSGGQAVQVRYVRSQANPKAVNSPIKANIIPK